MVDECGGELNGYSLPHPKNLLIITTARKRDTKDWEKECIPFPFGPDVDPKESGVQVVVDSWNNIGKYVGLKGWFVIFDEQRVVGRGAWAKSFQKIVKNNRWILLSATPGDTWSDYMQVFIANGFYKNQTEFERTHVVYSRFAKYHKVDRYIGCGTLVRHRREVVVEMPFERDTESHHIDIVVPYDKDLTKQVMRTRFDPYKKEPIQDAGALCYVLRHICNGDVRRLDAVREISKERPKLVIFYNFDYELESLRLLADSLKITYAEWNGHNHQPIPESDSWFYLVQYTAGAEGWNCIETNAMIFFSQNYSYKIMVQSAGRIDRMNTPFHDLYYYHLRSDSPIDKAIQIALRNKKNFNERAFVV
jgi:hypothetical protein